MLLSISAVVIISFFQCSPASPSRVLSPVNPENAVSTFEIEPGFKIELIASEPLINDPVDMEIDEEGHFYVVEMPGYPLDKSGSGKIKILTDTNNDGRMDKSTVFAESLVLPNSIMRWKKGVIVTDAPNVLYLEDTDGDGKSDIRDTLLTGFALSNPQHNVSNPVYGLDNWIYLGHEGAITTHRYEKEFGDPGGEIYFPKHLNSPRLQKNGFGRTVRFRPGSFELETTSSATQFGHTFDVWGHHLEVMYSNHLYHEVLAAQYLNRNPQLLVSDVTQPLSDHLDISEVYPINHQTDPLLPASVAMTAVGGTTAYLGGAFPAEFNTTVFTADASDHIIHVDQLKENGVSFTASRFREKKEFLASTDDWFTPVNHYIGPDGSLYVVDMYRQIIEHPEWLAEEVINSGKLYNGTGRGRIYKITATPEKEGGDQKDVAVGFTNEELLNKLGNANIWWRITAQRLLLDRGDKKIVPALEQMALNRSNALGRLHAMWTLNGLGNLSTDIIKEGLKDTEAGIRLNAIRLAELQLSKNPGLAEALLSLQNDPDQKVRFQLLCTLGFVRSPDAAAARNNILFRDINDKWIQLAALSAPPVETMPLLNAVLQNFKNDIPAYASLVQRLALMIGEGGDPVTISQWIQKAVLSPEGSKNEWQVPLIEGISVGMERNKSSAAVLKKVEPLLLNTFFNHPESRVRLAALKILQSDRIAVSTSRKSAMLKAVNIARDKNNEEGKRVEAIKFMSLSDPAEYTSSLQGWISTEEGDAIRMAALQTLATIPGVTVSDFVIEKWNSFSPALKETAMGTFLTGPERIAILLNAMNAGKITGISETAFRNIRAAAWSNADLKIIVDSMVARKQAYAKEVNASYQSALKLTGNPVKGKLVYQQNCIACHKFKGEGASKFGPDLGTVNNWQPEGIMANILQPNLSRSSGFEMWGIELLNGESYQGIISSESPSAITLSNFGVAEKTINRLDIKSLRVLYLSGMPSGLEKQIDKQSMADLIAFLRQQ